MLQRQTETKAQQRAEAKARRAAIPAALRAEKSSEICRKICALELYKSAGTLMLYRAFGSEADLSMLILTAERDGKRLAYPYCEDAVTITALRPCEEDAWEKGRYGIFAPRRTASELVPEQSIDLVICPALGFDRGGARLGMGAGCYDRFLPKCVNATVILAAFAEQEFECICRDGHDAPVHAIVTDRELIIV